MNILNSFWKLKNSKIKKISKEVGYFRAVSNKYGFDLLESTTEELEEITLGNSHGGIVAVTEERVLPHLSADSDILPYGFYVMIEGIEDPYNFGNALRSIYASISLSSTHSALL